ncbi:MAG TPA: type II toxin-antitoxin system VapC family toxin [Ktedonobacterales bacterium]|nr:type II toxin-antitoxin system VapC family toxin [Ktedonobacterales bacterium]
MSSDGLPPEESPGVGAARRIVVDASVAVKWHLRDEANVPEARKLLEHYAAGLVLLTAPAHIHYEVPSAITVATRGRAPRLTFEQGREAIDDFLALDIDLVHDEELIRAAYSLVHHYEVAFYDGLYLACASQLDCSLVTADRRFYQRISTLPRVVWIEDYPRVT